MLLYTFYLNKYINLTNKFYMELIVTSPYSVQITEDKWVKKHISNKFKETDTVSDIVETLKKQDLDLNSSIFTIIEER